MPVHLGLVDRATEYLAARIPEISYLLAAAFMIFASDFLMEHVMIRRLRQMSFLSRTFTFLLYGLLVLPALTAAGAFLLRAYALDKYREWIIVILAASFVLVGVLISIRYNLKMRIKIR